MHKKIALALCGGGGKGSYQIGVWKALEELEIYKNIEAFAGTSVGALNAVLFALGNYKAAEDIWLSISADDILTKHKTGTSGFCSREGLIKILRNVPLCDLKNSKPVYVNIYNNNSKNVEARCLNALSEDKIIECLLASSAIPIIFPSVEIEGKKYLDGGCNRLGNVPIDELYKKGYHNIIISSLDHNFNLYSICDSPLLQNPFKKIDINENYPSAEFTVLQPLSELGYLFKGTLNFSQTSIRQRILGGYTDTEKIIKGEGIYVMKENFNIEIKRRMEKSLENKQDMEGYAFFLNTSGYGNLNVDMDVEDKEVFWDNIVMLYGWKLQQHTISKKHYRLLDDEGKRRTWTNKPNDLLKALDEYEAKKLYGSIDINDHLKMKFESVLSSKKKTDDFISFFNSRYGNKNRESGTNGGKSLWNRIAEFQGLCLQQHKKFRKHYRIIDSNNRRLAWTLDPKKLLDAIDEFEKRYGK